MIKTARQSNQLVFVTITTKFPTPTEKSMPPRMMQNILSNICCAILYNTKTIQTKDQNLDNSLIYLYIDVLTTNAFITPSNQPILLLFYCLFFLVFFFKQIAW